MTAKYPLGGNEGLGYTWFGHSMVSQKTVDRAHAKAMKVKRYMETEYIPKDRPACMGGLTKAQKRRIS